MSPVTPQLHQYQRDAVEFVRARRRAGLLLDMGLGKTCISLTALSSETLPALVVAPKRVAEEVWSTEAELWRPDLRVVVAAGTAAKRKAALESDAEIIVISRDNIADAVPYAGKFKTFIIDELSSFKNRATARWRAAKKICKDMPYVWGLTGTPAPNGLLDLWSQMYLLDNGESLGTTLGGYRERFFTPGPQLPNGVVTRWDLRPGAQTRIHQLLERNCLSMATEGRVNLPPTTTNLVEVPFSPKVRSVYRELKKKLVVVLDDLNDVVGSQVFSASSAGALTAKLSQITAGFLYEEDADGSPLGSQHYTVLHRDKAKAVEEIYEGTGGSPLLVAYRFRAELDILQEVLGDRAHTLHEPGIIARWNRGEIPILLVHPASAGHGLNLQHGGHTMVWATLPWSLEEYQQTNKRLARQGQKHPVVIHHLITPRSIDPLVLQSLTDKTEVQKALLEHLETPL